jgi:molybdopterin-containing oxidoreductase family molybdopterin binding subunit
MSEQPGTIMEDVWIHTSCGGCYGQCGVKVRRKNGMVVEIEGNPDSTAGSGRICAKGTAQLMTLYDPHRLNYPVKRTNPEKGVGVDPMWEQISWEEALDIIVTKLKDVKEKDPRGVYFQATTVQTSEIRFAVPAFMKAFGFKNYWVSGGGLWCGNGAHFMNGIMHASWSIIPDFEYNNYTMYFGCSKGHGAGHAALQTAQQVADARARGMKAVVFDPYLSTQAAKGEEWVPIRVGTDGAMALGMINVLLNEFDIYDAEYLKLKTNAGYLIQDDGHYIRDKATNKPLIWDPVDKKAKTFDDETIKDYALEGSFQVDGISGTPSFQLFKEHVKKEYTVEKVSKITSVPEKVIRRIAKEFGENAQIGSTIMIDGKELPLRPSAAIFFRGSQGHVNSGWTCLSIDLLNHVVGAADVPGGSMGHGPPVSMGHPDTGKPDTVPYACDDGLMIVKGWVYDHKPYPLRKPQPPTRLDLQDMFPCSVYNAFTICSEDWEKYLETFKIDYRPSIMVNFGSNSVMTMGNAEQVTENFLKKFDFIFSFNIYHNEFTEAVADVVLPDACFLERYTPCVTFPSTFCHPTGVDSWVWQIRQPVVEQQYERRDFNEVMLEIAKRLEIQDKYYEAINNVIPVRYGGEMSEKYILDTKGDYSWQDVCDRVLKDRLGDDKGLEELKKTGLVKWKTRVEERYWRWFVPVRVPIYFEYFLEAGEEGRKVAESFGMPEIADWNFYKPLAQWNPCPSHTMDGTEFDLWAFCWRPSFHTQSSTQNNPWLDEISMNDPWVYLVQLNEDTGKKKGLVDGDMIWIENAIGKKIKGAARLVQGVHPEHVCIAGCHGHWAKGTPIAAGKGVFFDDLTLSDLAHTDSLTQGSDTCVKVKIYKCEEGV